ncbi:protein huluwa isoform X2 [Trematomus bernacchii]|uniref:protein huluwa isoform X2 n=1 Tax=Trematomus bernacchii TaxID=40690 RepID=UPI00146F8EE6|nr:protein huluwa isoform X2 [Trematomus bernacchii]
MRRDTSIEISNVSMSQIIQSPSPNLEPGFSVTNLTLVVLLLIPCVVVLLLLNCLFLGYKFLILSQKKGDGEEMLLESCSLQGPRRLSGGVFPALQDVRRAYLSLSEPIPHPVTSSRVSSRERVGGGVEIRLLRPDGATGSLRAPSSIRGPSSAAEFSPRMHLHPRSQSTATQRWCKSAPVLPQSSESESEAETRVNLVPPNSPTEVQHEGHLRRSSTHQMLRDLSPGVAVLVFDKVEMECEFSNTPSEESGLNSSAVGPGLDSDFGASAGVSLRILSADSDGLSNGILSSALEWDYYDPCYVKQNNVHKHKHHRPAVHTKQYWV